MALRIALIAAIAAALAVPAAATAGGWATVGFDPPPEGLAPGEPWQVDLTVLQHGRTPLEGVHPRVIVRSEDGGEPESFPARATGKPGVYRATVVFESAGTWKLAVDDGFTATHRFPAVQIGKGGQGSAEPVAGAPGRTKNGHFNLLNLLLRSQHLFLFAGRCSSATLSSQLFVNAEPNGG
jgi:hypothetical protein